MNECERLARLWQLLLSEALGAAAVAAAAAGQRGPERHVPLGLHVAAAQSARALRAAPPHHPGVHLPDVRAATLQQTRATHL